MQIKKSKKITTKKKRPERKIIVACNFVLLCLCYGLLVKQSSMSCLFEHHRFKSFDISLTVYAFSSFVHAFFIHFLNNVCCTYILLLVMLDGASFGPFLSLFSALLLVCCQFCCNFSPSPQCFFFLAVLFING